MPVHTQGSLLGGRYRVLRHLGSGGMASVLLCHDERLDREVAVKRLHADSPDDVERRFVREAKLGASLNHPNLVSVFDTATDDEGVLIVMEYVEGEALSRALRRGPLEPERVVAIVCDVADALDHAHAQGVVHRDVKPGNVLLRHDGVTKLVDLGIATAADQTKITHSGIVLGTAAYMAPEQLEGGKPTPATDVYALAVVAYEALTGMRAREGRTPMEVAHRIATSPPPDLRDVMPDASPGAADVLKQAMARDPAERPGSAGELAHRLARALGEPPTVPRSTRPVPAPAPMPAPEPAAATPPPPPTGPARRPRRDRGRRPVVAIVLALALLALAAATVIGAVLSSGGDDDEPQRAENRQQQPAEGKKAEKGEKAEKKEEPKSQEEQQAQPAPAPAPEEPAPEEAPATSDPASGVELNNEGFALMQQGDYAGAVPILQEAVASWPEDSQDINYAYALFNLGKSLNRSGRPDEAIPYLEKRLQWDDQKETVEAELELARENAEEG